MVLGLVGYLLWVDFKTCYDISYSPSSCCIWFKILRKEITEKVVRDSLEEIGTLSSLVSETLRGMRIIKAYRKEKFLSK